MQSSIEPPELNAKKLFEAAIHIVVQKASAFLTVSHSRLIFAHKDGASPSGAPNVVSL